MGKNQWPKKSFAFTRKKERRLLYAPILNCRGDVFVDEGVDEWEPEQLITGPCDSVTVSDFKAGKQGLNSRLRASTAGGGGNGSHTVPYHVTGNGRSTRHSRWVIKPTRRTTRNFFSHTNSSTPLLNSIHCFCDWGRRYSQVRFSAIQFPQADPISFRSQAMTRSLVGHSTSRA